MNNYQNYYNPNAYSMQQNPGYTNYNQNYHGVNANNQYQAYPQQATNNQMTGFDFVNGIEDAKKYIVSPNKTMYLKDLSTNMIFIKKCDNQGRYALQTFELNELNQDTSNDFVKKADFEALVASVNNLTKMVENSFKSQKTDLKTQNISKR